LAAGRDTVATAGFLVDAVSGRAQFVTIYADGGELRTLSVTGPLTLSGSGTLETTSGYSVGGLVAAVVLTTASVDRINFYTGSAAETAVGFIQAGGTYLKLQGPTTAAGNSDLVLDQGFATLASAGTITFKPYDDIALTLTPVALIATLPLRAASGSDAAPAFSFSADTNTGMYRSDADKIGLAAGGSQVAEITADGIYAGTPATGLPVMRPTSDDLDYCSYSFGNDADTGMNRTAANALVLVAGAVERLKVDDDGSGNCVLVYVSGALHRVSEGAVDSGGAGYKVLRVPN